jgi:molybdopterin synthase sulfur carrier subunit
MEVLFFGQLTDLTGVTSLSCDHVADTDQLMTQLKEKYPALATATFMVAVNNRMITENTVIEPGSKIAIMPPFSGG